jgi:hypothetical protein
MNAEQTLAESRAAIRTMLSCWNDVPAILCDRHFTVLESSKPAQALSPGFTKGTNLARFTFLEADVDRRHAMYEVAADQVATMLRESLDQHQADDTFREIVGELAAKSTDFSVAWADDSLSAKSGDLIVFDKTPVGSIRLRYQVLRVPENSEDSLIVWTGADDDSHRLLSALTEVKTPDDSV